MSKIFPLRRSIICGRTARTRRGRGCHQRIEYHPPFPIVRIGDQRGRCLDRQIGDQHIDPACFGQQVRRFVRRQQGERTGDDRRAMFPEYLAQHRPHEGIGMSDENALSGKAG